MTGRPASVLGARPLGETNHSKTEQAETESTRLLRGSRAYWVLAALVGGILLGALSGGLPKSLQGTALQVASAIGGMWLNALKMTVIPLIVALMVTAVARGADAARTGRIAAMSLVWFAVLYVFSAVLGAIFTPLILRLLPLPDATAEALRAGIAAIDLQETTGPIPGVSDFFQSLISPNIFASAAADQVLPLVVFALLFALAVSRLPPVNRLPILSFFQSIAQALLVLIGWILWIAPLGVFALSFGVGSGAGAAALSAVIHYIIVVSLVGVGVLAAAYLIALLVGRTGPVAFGKAMLGPQTVAITTQSSLVSLPAMLGSARLLAIREEVADVTLPLAVALFRGTGPAMNLAVVIYIAHAFGVDLSLAHLIAATAIASVMSYSSVSLPGQIGFFATIAPIAVAAGVPVAPLALFVAVETIPDIFRTLGNVTLDVAVTSAVRQPGGEWDEHGPSPIVSFHRARD